MPWAFYTASGVAKTGEYLGSEFAIGTVVQSASTSPKEGWLLCDGSAVSRTTYSDLFNAVGTAYGSGNGTTTFNVPDATGCVIYARSLAERYDAVAKLVGTTPQYATALPSSPIDGQEIYYAADATNGVIWHLRYRSGATGSYKWEYVGGPPLIAEVTTLEYTSSASYTALTTAGPSIAIPVAGDYDVTLGAFVQQPQTANAAHYMSYDIGGTGAVDADGIRFDQYDNTNPRSASSQFRLRRKTALTTVTLTAKYKAGGGGNCGWANRIIEVRPVRVG